MAREPNEKAAIAKSRYHRGEKLVDIARELGVPAGTVRRWKNVYGWDSERSGKFANIRTPKENARVEEKTEVPPVFDNSELTDRQKLFCIHYIKSFNATQAYLKAYGCSYQTALTNGPGMLKLPKVADEIFRMKKERYAKAFLSPEDIFQKYLDIAFADITDFISFGQEERPVIGKYGPIMIKNPDTREDVPLTQTINVVRSLSSTQVDGTILAEVSQNKNGSFKIKLADRMKALQWLADHMDMATEEQKVKIEKIKAETLKLKGDDAQQGDNGLLDMLRQSANEVFGDEVLKIQSQANAGYKVVESSDG